MPLYEPYRKSDPWFIGVKVGDGHDRYGPFDTKSEAMFKVRTVKSGVPPETEYDSIVLYQNLGRRSTVKWIAGRKYPKSGKTPRKTPPLRWVKVPPEYMYRGQ